MGTIQQGAHRAAEQETFKNISFSQEVVEDGEVTGFVETGSSKTYDSDGELNSSSEFEYSFDASEISLRH